MPPFLVVTGPESAGGVLRAQQACYLAAVLALPCLAAWPRARRELTERPRRALLALLLADFAFLLWLTVPFVPLGVDETFFAINANVYRGNDTLWLCWNRPPLASLGAALCPWHPPLVGLVLRALTAWLAHVLAERCVPAPWTLAAPYLVLVSSQLTLFSAGLMSEPYGAFALAAFACVAARPNGPAWLAGAVAGAAFLSRWPLGWLLPVALFVGWRRRFVGVASAALAFAVPVVTVVAASGTRPWAMLGDRSEWTRSAAETFVYFLRPDVGFGVGWLVLALGLVGAFANRAVAVRWCAVLAAACAAALVLMGEATMRLMTPAVPLVAVAAAAGMHHVATGRSRPLPAWTSALVVGLVGLSTAFPVRPLRNRALARVSPQYTVLQHRDTILRLVGDAPLHTDCNFIAVTAVLDHRCLAVTGVDDGPSDRRHHPAGVGLDLEGSTPPCARDRLPPGSPYLTFDPAGRTVLWQADGLCLVRW